MTIDEDNEKDSAKDKPKLNKATQFKYTQIQSKNESSHIKPSKKQRKKKSKAHETLTKRQIKTAQKPKQKRKQNRTKIKTQQQTKRI